MDTQGLKNVGGNYTVGEENKTKSSHFLFSIIKPKTENEDSKRQEFILNVILAGSLIFSGIAIFLEIWQMLFLENFRGELPIVPIGVFFVFLCLYVFSRLGSFKESSYFLIGIYFFTALYTVVKWGIDLPLGLLIFILVIIISGILININFSFFITICSSTAIILLAYLQNNFIIHPNLYWKKEMLKIADAATIGAVFLLLW